ncbi:hypothetical protein LINGRAHAP2_LOCUS7253 [Linum grandiflorum]
MLPPNQWHDFFSASAEDWWWGNLQPTDRQVKFGLGCWVIWKSRNQRVFNNDSISKEGLRAQVACWATPLLQCETEANELRQANSTVRIVREVAWEPQSEPWLTLNVDGSVNHAGQAARGGGGWGCPLQSFWRLFTHIHGQLWEVLYYESRAARHC